MMRARQWKQSKPRRQEALTAGILVGAYTLGALLGVFAANQAEGEVLSGTLSSCLEAVTGGTARTSWLTLVWSCGRLPLGIFLCGFSVLGLVGIPAAFGVEGFTLAYSVSACLRVYGSAGYPLALAAFGLGGGIALAAMVLLGVQGFQAAGTLLTRRSGGRQNGVDARRYGQRCLVALLLVILQIVEEKFVVLPLLAAVIGKLSG